MGVVFSGIQPSGRIHIGNYLGAIRYFIELQNNGHDCFYSVVDMHAMTTYNYKDANCVQLVKQYLAFGIHPGNIFIQSSVLEHANIMWMLMCDTQVSWLNRMTQFKSKKDTNKSAGLLSYPVLMAADILAYKADIVPVGQDQEQHLELVRYIASSFNNYVNSQFFTIPKSHGCDVRIMSLRNPENKMSKSDNDIAGCLFIDDTDDEILKKVNRAKTCSEFDEKNIGIKNLINIYNLFHGKEKKFNSCKDLKESLIDVLLNFIKNFRYNYNSISDKEVMCIIDKGQKRAAHIAHNTLAEMRSLINTL